MEGMSKERKGKRRKSRASSSITEDATKEKASTVTLQANFLQKITFDTHYTNRFAIRICSRTLFISSEHNTI